MQLLEFQYLLVVSSKRMDLVLLVFQEAFGALWGHVRGGAKHERFAPGLKYLLGPKFHCTRHI